LESEIINVLSIEKASEKLRFKPFEKCLNNKFLLWHGLKQCNLASVIRDGLRLPPAEAPSTGYMFGKGLYFSDSSSKAMIQSVNPSTRQGEAFIILCEVALGTMHKVFKPHQFAKAPMYHHSVYGVGQQKPKLIGIKDLRSED